MKIFKRFAAVFVTVAATVAVFLPACASKDISPVIEDAESKTAQYIKTVQTVSSQSHSVSKTTSKNTGKVTSQQEKSNISTDGINVTLNIPTGDGDVLEYNVERNDYGYTFVRGGKYFTYSAKAEADNFSGKQFYIDKYPQDAFDGADGFFESSAVIMYMGNAANAVKSASDSIEINLNKVINCFLKDVLASMNEGKTVEQVLRRDIVKKYFKDETLTELTEYFATTESISELNEILRAFGLSADIEAETVLDIDLSDFEAAEKTLNDKVFSVTKEETEEDDETKTVEKNVTEIKNLKIKYSLDGNAVTGYRLCGEVKIASDYSREDADETGNIYSSFGELGLSISEKAEVSASPYPLADISAATVRYSERCLEEGRQPAYLSKNSYEAAERVYSQFSYPSLNVYIKDGVVADIESSDCTCVYEKTNRAVTFSKAGKESLTLYVNVKRIERASGAVLRFEFYVDKEDMLFERRCFRYYESPVGNGVQEDKGYKYRVYPREYVFGLKGGINSANVTVSDGKITNAVLGENPCAYNAANGKITATADGEIIVYYITTVLSDDGYFTQLRFYAWEADAQAANEKFDAYATLYMTDKTVTETVQEFLNKQGYKET